MNADEIHMHLDFLLAVQPLGVGDEIAEASYKLVLRMMQDNPAPWADDDPFAAERWLAAHGASPEIAAKNAAEFEVSARALTAIKLGYPPITFNEVAEVFNEVIRDG
ncbi:hypothetical protein [Streptacidiphilus carbonis]|uniref:hypothetical protein n=1 Tax=Streptacidiphilus carbonis TaxID=105422 RepID=UPI0005AB2CC2|nr:hypothetical protein [Streptacidiphilus carbonis]